ncbi:MAG TPA: hypothetical protein VE991_11445, partial [Acidimicrobiales bacterium]|nr:hypothetical protein [Acidimicrobiales bacterium]
PSQPQTLQGAVMLAYITAFFGVIGLLFHQYWDVISLGLGIGGFGVANERRWGYWTAAVLAILNVLLDVGYVITGSALNILNLLFAVVLAALLLHPQSRQYQRIWFK